MNGRFRSALALGLLVMREVPDASGTLSCLQPDATGYAYAITGSSPACVLRGQHALSGYVPPEWNNMSRFVVSLHLSGLVKKQGQIRRLRVVAVVGLSHLRVI